jgi:hypothetical protein
MIWFFRIDRYLSFVSSYTTRTRTRTVQYLFVRIKSCRASKISTCTCTCTRYVYRCTVHTEALQQSATLNSQFQFFSAESFFGSFSLHHFHCLRRKCTQFATFTSEVTMSERKAVIKNADMSEVRFTCFIFFGEDAKINLIFKPLTPLGQHLRSSLSATQSYPQPH